MYETLHQYLVHHKVLPFPGFGTFLLERRPAEADHGAREIRPPVYTVSLHEKLDDYPHHFFSWLAHQLDMNDREAMSRFHEFAEDARRKVNDGYEIDWKGLGRIRRGSAGLLLFEPEVLKPGEPVRAFKVLRGDAQHLVRVGEDHRTSGQMSELLGQKSLKRKPGLLIPAILVILAAVFIAWYLYSQKAGISPLTNRQKIPVQQPAESIE